MLGMVYSVAYIIINITLKTFFRPLILKILKYQKSAIFEMILLNTLQKFGNSLSCCFVLLPGLYNYVIENPWYVYCTKKTMYYH